LSRRVRLSTFYSLPACSPALRLIHIGARSLLLDRRQNGRVWQTPATKLDLSQRVTGCRVFAVSLLASLSGNFGARQPSLNPRSLATDNDISCCIYGILPVWAQRLEKCNIVHAVRTRRAQLYSDCFADVKLFIYFIVQANMSALAGRIFH